MRTFEAMRAVEALQVPKGPKALLLALLRCERGGLAVRSHGALAQAVGASRRSILRWQVVLEGMGLIEVRRRFARGSQLRSSYRVELRLLAQLASVGREAVSAVVLAVKLARDAVRSKKIGCDTVAHSHGQEALRAAWAVLADARSSAENRKKAVAALAGAGQGTATEIEALFSGS